MKKIRCERYRAAEKTERDVHGPKKPKNRAFDCLCARVAKISRLLNGRLKEKIHLEEIMKIAFVCTGNTCRSPMAEYYLRKLIEERDIEGIRVTSFGLGGFPGYQASLNSVRAMERLQIDISDHRSRTANPEMLDQDLFLTMACSHRDVLHSHLRESLVFTLKEFENLDEEELERIIEQKKSGQVLALSPASYSYDFDIADPYGGSLEEYVSTGDEILSAIDGSLDKILKLKRLLG